MESDAHLDPIDTIDADFMGFDHDPSASQINSSLLRMLPENHTLNSQGENPVILISFQDTKILDNPILVAKLMKDSAFNKYPIKDIRTNKKRKIIAVELMSTSDKMIKNLLKIDKLGTYPVTCRLPKNDHQTSGVIFPISTEITVEEIKECLIIRDNQPSNLYEVSSIERLKKKVDGLWVDSQSIKITLMPNKLPEAETIYYSYYKVKPFVQMPLQCFNCQKLGHTALSCKGKTRCLLCGENHKKDECLRTATEFKCANCQGAHKANSTRCELYNVAKKIENTRIYEKKSYKAAKETVLTRYYSNKNGAKTDAMGNERNVTYRNALIGSESSSTINKKYENKEVQTTSVENTENFLELLKKCMMEIMENFVLKNDSVPIEDIVEKVVEKNFECEPKIAAKRTSSKISTTSGSDEDVLPVRRARQEELWIKKKNSNKKKCIPVGKRQ